MDVCRQCGGDLNGYMDGNGLCCYCEDILDGVLADEANEECKDILAEEECYGEGDDNNSDEGIDMEGFYHAIDKDD